MVPKTKRHHAPLSLVLFLLVIFSPLLRPSLVSASTLTSFTGQVKAIFVKGKEEDQQKLATTQTMDLFKPVVIDSTTTNGADTPQKPDQEALQAVSGPLRVSTEDIDFPISDAISVYEVKKGDTIEDVAKLFDVSVNTIMWANNLSSRKITKGDTLIILPITGIKHNVKKGDTIASIAKKYRADEGDVAIYNGLAVDTALSVGDTIIVPDGEIDIVQTSKPKAPKTKKSRILNSYVYSTPSGFLIRPIVGGRKTQGLHGHNGIDLASSVGAPILASASGRIIAAKVGGYNGGYGNMIIVSHENGVQTVYAHLKAVNVTVGQEVSQGQVIGELGNTGRSTGPHLHFEVRGAKNPF